MQAGMFSGVKVVAHSGAAPFYNKIKLYFIYDRQLLFIIVNKERYKIKTVFWGST